MLEPEQRPIHDLPWWQQTQRAFAELRRDYHWTTKLVTAALAFFAVVGTVDVFTGTTVMELLGFSNSHVGVRLEKALISDPFLMLLTLLIALFVGIALKRHQLLGKLDGADHYTIGRALAYGYFKNFLVGALLRAQADGQRLHVFKPRNVDELKTFETQVWPRLEPERNTRVLEVKHVAQVDRKPIQRRIIVIDELQGGTGPLYFDFPTTLFTVADYYEMWNEWSERNRPAAFIAKDRLPGYQQQQINDFFRHLRELVEGSDGLPPVGPRAVQEHGLDAATLQRLFRDHLVELSLDELRVRLGIGS